MEEQRLLEEADCPDLFCDLLSELRGVSGLTQARLAKKVHYAAATIANWEDCDTWYMPPTVEVVDAIARALECDTVERTRLIRAHICDLLGKAGYFERYGRPSQSP